MSVRNTYASSAINTLSLSMLEPWYQGEETFAFHSLTEAENQKQFEGELEQRPGTQLFSKYFLAHHELQSSSLIRGRVNTSPVPTPWQNRCYFSKMSMVMVTFVWLNINTFTFNTFSIVTASKVKVLVFYCQPAPIFSYRFDWLVMVTQLKTTARFSACDPSGCGEEMTHTLV